MGNVLSSQKIGAALNRAKNICIVEEPVDIDGNHLVVRNLRPAEYDTIMKSLAGIKVEAEYLNAWQVGYGRHAIVEVNGVDLRGVDFIETDETDSKGKKVKFELATYLRDQLVSTWSKEAVYTVYRKVGDAIAKAETDSNSNVRFLVPDESPEEKYRRLFGELKDVEDELPSTLVDSILDEHGLMRKSTAAEIKTALEKDSAEGWEEVQRKKREEEAAKKAPCAESLPDPMQKGKRIACELPENHEGDHIGRGLMWEKQAPKAPPVDLATRQPLNRVAIDVPQPAAPPQREVVPARPMTKAERFAALEADADQIGAIPREAYFAQAPVEVPELAQKQERRNSRDAITDLDKPPVVGLNPKFRPPPR